MGDERQASGSSVPGPLSDEPMEATTRAAEGEDGAELDPANQSLSDALRVSFFVLKLVIVALIVGLALTGTRTVDEGKVAVRLLFGAVAGEPGQEVLEPGGPYFWPPEPIGRFVWVETTERRIELDRGFWHSAPDGTEVAPAMARQRGLIPGEDGSLLTADKNIVHGRWAVHYQVNPAEAVNFVTHVSASPDLRRQRMDAARIVQAAAERAIVRAVAQVNADDFIRAQIDREAIQGSIQAELDELRTGIRVTRVLLEEAIPPVAVRDAFEALSRAESRMAREVEEARQRATSMLINTAGDQHELLLEAIEAYELARMEQDESRIAEAEAQIEAVLSPERAQGEAGERIRYAVNYRRSVESNLRSRAEQFQRLLPEYRRNPRITRDRIWQDTRQAVLAGDVETFYLPGTPGKELLLEINRDPRIQRERELRRYRQEQEQEAEQRRRQIERQMERAGMPPPGVGPPGGGPGAGGHGHSH